MQVRIRLCVIVATALFCAKAAYGDFPTTQPYPEVRYVHQAISGERPQQVHAAWIDISDRDVEVRVAAGGPDPDGSTGEWQTTLLPPSSIATRENFDIVVNG